MMARVETDAESNGSGSGSASGSGSSGDSSGDESASGPVADDDQTPTAQIGPQEPHHHSDEQSISSSSSSSSSSEDENEDTETLEKCAVEAEDKISKNPYVYNDHVDLLTVLHKLGDISRLRKAYERLDGMCPIAPSQWLQRLQSEVKNSSNLADRNQIHKLFKQAFTDCYSVHLYTEWCATSLGNGKEDKDTRNILNEALRLAGSDPIDGAMLWDTVREFELALLYVMDTSSENYKSQVLRIFDIFNQQLSRPLLQSEKTIEEFRSFVDIMETYISDAGDLVKKVEDAHIISEIVLKQLLEFENDLEGTATDEAQILAEKHENYKSYIAYVKTLLNDKKLKDCDIVGLLGVLYDRMTSECFAPFCRGESSLPEDAEQICLEYVEYAREHNSDEYCLDVIEKVIRRYHRNSTLCVLKLQQLERMGKDVQEIKMDFETALFTGFDTAQDYVALWLCYLEILRRKTDFNSLKQIEVLRKTFRLSWDNLSQMWGDEADKEFTILQYWARIEYYHTKDYQYGEELFKEIFDYGDNKLRGGLWMEYIRLELHRGGESRARLVYKNALKHSPDPRLQYSWLALERDFGTLDTLIECNKICKIKALEWADIQAKKAPSVNSNYKTNKGNYVQNNVKNKKKNNNVENDTKKSLKRPYSNNGDESHPKEKASKTSNSISPAKSRYEPNSVPNKDQNKSVEPKPNLKRKTDFAADVPSKKPKESIPTRDSKKISNDDETPEEKNKRTVFVSNLDFKVNENELREKLSNFGLIEELRLVNTVKFHGSICYCVYEDVKSVDVALAHDRTLLNDRPMFIARYTEKGDRKKHFTYSTGIEKNKLFVKNISFEHCTEEHLRKAFEKYGNLIDIRIVTHKTGRPKGIAYVEYDNTESAAKALEEVDGLELGGRNLSVALSAPPPKVTLPEITPPSSSRGSSRTMLFVPRVLQAPTSKNSSQETSTSSSKLSNSDFKNMFLGNCSK